MSRTRPTLHSIQLTRHVSVTFQRTLRIPDDGAVYPLPPGLGAFPVRRVRDFGRRVPAAWRERGGYFIPLYQREAMWISFGATYWRPSAVTIGVGGVNAISGTPWGKRLRRRPQNYVVVPDQPWLDGINAGRGVIRQFVAMPLGQGYTVEGQLTGQEAEGGLQFSVIEPRQGRFPTRTPHLARRSFGDGLVCCEAVSSSMGLAAGGRMHQSIYPDRYPADTWDAKRLTTAHVHIVNSEMYEEITGEAAPPSPISARTYTEHGFPWFALYDEHKGDIAPSKILAGIKPVAALDWSNGKMDEAETDPLCVPHNQIVTV